MSFLCKCLSHRIIRASLAVTMTSLMLLLAGCASNQPADSIAGNAAGQADVSAKSEAADITDSAAGQNTAGQADASAESKTPDMADSTADQSSSAQDREDISVPKSVVAVSKSNADLWLLAGGELSGTTEDAMELDGISENTAVVGTLSKPNSEAILALEPDLVLLAVDIPAQKELKAELDEMGIRTMAIEINSFEDYKLTDRLFRNARDLTRSRSHPDLTHDPDLFTDHIISLRSVLRICRKSCLKFDYIFIIPQGKESEAMESYKTQFESNEVWSSLDAVNRGRLYTMPKDYFQYKPNAQWDLAYEYVRDLLKES